MIFETRPTKIALKKRKLPNLYFVERRLTKKESKTIGCVDSTFMPWRPKSLTIALREKCHKCGAKKDVARGGGTKRPGEGGGYREFDEADEERRKRRAIEERDLKAERKATKTKCEYCKRASCIC